MRIGAFEAKNKLSALLEMAERGEEIVITRHGRPVAKLVPVDDGRNPRRVQAAVEGLRVLAGELNLGPFDWSEWSAYRDEGRR
ncbi:MAG: type II toxin-antitoxin system Phd/YefM family antitoxin [Alphaproteobacteria bacterium]